MGAEALCTVDYNGQTVEAKAHLETDSIIVRGALRLTIPLQEIVNVEAADGVLTVTFKGERAAFHVGSYAAKWEDKIRNPKTLLEKLGVKASARVSVLGVTDPLFWQQLRAITNDISEGKPAGDSDWIFLQAEDTDTLQQLVPLQDCLKRNGAIWVVYPKGQKHITEVGVINTGIASGLVDVKVARFSDTHTALKMVIPVARRI
jgi:coenzyme F420-reducing hydrogenase delta subunit